MINQKTRTVSKKSRDEIHYRLEKKTREREQKIRRQAKSKKVETEH